MEDRDTDRRAGYEERVAYGKADKIKAELQGY